MTNSPNYNQKIISDFLTLYTVSVFRCSMKTNKIKKIFTQNTDKEIEALTATKQNKITTIILFVGFIIWFIWIFFDYLFAYNVWLKILPIRIIGGLSFLFGYLFRNKLTYQQKQHIIFFSITSALAYMFAIIDKQSFPTYFTGFTFTTAITYQTFHINRSHNLLYSLSTISVFCTTYILNTYTIVEILGGGGFATLSILLLMIFIADNNYHSNIEFFRNTLTIQQQKIDIEDKNKSITESITYAKRIQMSILPNEEVIRKNFQDVFILYKPKDIVSGDFYWFAQHDEKIVIAVGDCTGHGVPGAFMTMINNNFLNQVIKEQQILDPSKALTSVREKVIYTLNPHQNETYIKDGMDISLLSIDTKTFSVEFSGANRPLWVMREDTIEQLEEIQGDKIFIGYDEDWQNKNFHKKEFTLNKGDRIYLFTDGITDQFGGERDKKFGKNNLKQLLHQNFYQPMRIQKYIIEETLTQWQGNNPQTDDMCIIGIQI